MDENQQKPQQNPPKKSHSAWGIIVIFIIVVILIAAFYLWQQSTNENVSTVAVIDSKTNTNENVGGYGGGPGVLYDQVHALFQDAVNQNNFALTVDYLADTVMFIIEATECCGEITAKEAAAQLDYMNGVTFNFSQAQQIVKQIKTNLGHLGFADETIGIADTKQVISYHINTEGKIDEVYLSASHELMDLE